MIASTNRPTWVVQPLIWARVKDTVRRELSLRQKIMLLSFSAILWTMSTEERTHQDPTTWHTLGHSPTIPNTLSCILHLPTGREPAKVCQSALWCLARVGKPAARLSHTWNLLASSKMPFAWLLGHHKNLVSLNFLPDPKMQPKSDSDSRMPLHQTTWSENNMVDITNTGTLWYRSIPNRLRSWHSLSHAWIASRPSTQYRSALCVIITVHPRSRWGSICKVYIHINVYLSSFIYVDVMCMVHIDLKTKRNHQWCEISKSGQKKIVQSCVYYICIYIYIYMLNVYIYIYMCVNICMCIYIYILYTYICTYI